MDNFLIYDYRDNSVRTCNFRLIGTAPTLTAAAMSFPPGTVFRPMYAENIK